MFRKLYKEANDDIKPSEELLGSVIQNAHKRQPPAKRQHMKYAASIAAAVVAVSAAVISMPVWQSVTDKDDGIIIEERASETAPPQSADAQDTSLTDAFPTQNPQSDAAADPPENTSDNSYDYHSSDKVFLKNVQSSAMKSAESGALPKVDTENAANTEYDVNIDETEKNDVSGGEQSQENSVDSENKRLKQEVEDTALYEALPERTPPPAVQNAMTYAAEGSADAGVAENIEIGVSRDEISVPTPQGYQCTRASWNGYTFVSEDGAEINVVINYGGGEDSEPYYSTDGGNIYASFTAHGMTVTVSASGADMGTVEEIINSLR